MITNPDRTFKTNQKVFGGIHEPATTRGWMSVLWLFAPEVDDGPERMLTMASQTASALNLTRAPAQPDD
ncbi:MAG: hypothetical protein ABF391_06260 [Akkermansiaceae bacterium]|jgi:hypothetical protein